MDLEADRGPGNVLKYVGAAAGSRLVVSRLRVRPCRGRWVDAPPLPMCFRANPSKNTHSHVVWGRLRLLLLLPMYIYAFAGAQSCASTPPHQPIAIHRTYAHTGRSCSACKKASTGGPDLNVRLHCHEHDGVNNGGHDQVPRAAISN